MMDVFREIKVQTLAFVFTGNINLNKDRSGS